MCCGTCNIVRLKSPDIYHTNVENVGENLPVVLTTPFNPPTDIASGHTLHERYDDGLAWWTYNGNTWDLNYTWVQSDGCCTYFEDQPGNTIDINDLPSAPITSPAAPNTGDTIIENYDNGQVYWTWNGTAWVLDFAVTTTDIHHTHYDNSANALDETVLPTAPANPPTGIQDEHTLHELYSNGQIFWTWNGTNWVRDYIITDCCHTQDNQLANTLDCTTLPTAPLNPPANATTNDTLHERYVNGSMYWLYNGTAWIYEFHICDGDVGSVVQSNVFANWLS